MIEQLIKNWQSIGLLDGVKPEKVKDFACALENQRTFNEEESLPPPLMRMSIPLVYRLMSGLDDKIVSSLQESRENYIQTNVDYNPPKIDGTIMLHREAEYITVLVPQLIQAVIHYLNENHKQNFLFSGVGLINNKIVIFGR